MKSVLLDSRSKKRLRFASSKQRSAKASANVYHSYKGRIAGGVTSAATREHLVHNPSGDERAKKRRRKNQSSGASNDRNRTAVFDMSERKSDDKSKDDDLQMKGDKERSELEEIQNYQSDEEAELGQSIFASELDLAQERNASEIFGQFHRKIWIYSRSLPEILHNLDTIVDVLMAYMLSPADLPERPTPSSDDSARDDEGNDKSARQEFIVNLATTDILHLISVLARDLRHEIHPYLHDKLLPRIINDLLNPPPPPPESNSQPIPLDVTLVEASFRTMAYVFRYDFALVVNDMESMRQYYGSTLGHRRELIRRLSAETFAPLIRRMKSQTAKERHIRRVLKALDATTKLPPSRTLQRTQNDAVNGLAQLMFQLVRGVSSELHSQGQHVLRFLFEHLKKASGDQKSNDDDNTRDLAFDVVLGMMDKVCYHSKSSTFSKVSGELFSVFSAAFAEDDKILGTITARTIIKYLKLSVKVTTFRSGYLLEEHSDEDLKPLFDAVSRLCSGSSLARLPALLLSTMTELLCKLWISLEGRKSARIYENVKNLLRLDYKEKNSVSTLSVVLSKDLLPRLESDSNRTAIASLLLEVAADISQQDPNAAVGIVFAIVSSMSGSPSNAVNGDRFRLFCRLPGEGNTISSEQRESLLECIMQKHKSVEKNRAKISLALRCVPLLTTLFEEEDFESVYKKVADWVLGILDKSMKEKCYIIGGMAIEAFAAISAVFPSSSRGRSMTEKLSRRVLETAERLVLSDTGSLWIIRGAASLAPLVRDLSLQWKDEDALLDVLVTNLRSDNHFMRLYSLQMLETFPTKNFVVDHADLDLTDDLDEEVDQPYKSGNSDSPKQGPVGPCGMLKTLLDLELSPVRLSKERELVSLVAKVDVLSRTGRLPAIYAEAAMNHMLGIFHIKFAPLWPEAQKAVVNLMTTYQDTVWSPFEAKLVAMMNGSRATAELITRNEGIEGGSIFEEHYKMCKNWEASHGRDVAVFGTSVEVEEGNVPCFHATDEVTVMESVWKAAEEGHKIVVKHSRVLVPLFLSFLHNDFFPSYGKDQDARELHLEDFVMTKQ
ncbi:MAG: hypothetical protein SGILL_002458 [Bacillariaceae sp.]